MKLISDWRNYWKFKSVQLQVSALIFDAMFIVVAAVQESWPMSPFIYCSLRVILTLASMFARIVKQKIDSE